MLIDFTVNNYKSIKNEISVDMCFSQRAPNGYSDEDILYFKETKGYRIIPFLAMYGANASGKSNIISAMNTLKKFIVNDCNSKEGIFPYFPYLLSDKSRDATCDFKMILEKSGIVYEYSLSFNRQEIVDETLNIINADKSKKTIFDVKQNVFNIKVPQPYDLKTIYENECNHISSFLVKLAGKYSKFSTDVNNVYSFIKNDLEIYTSNSFHESFAVDKATTDGDLQKAIVKISKILSNMDINLEQVNCNRSISTINSGEEFNIPKNSRVSWQIKDPNKMQVRFDSFKSVHKDDQGKKVEFDFLTQESYGTITLFGLLGVVIDVLINGKTLIIDEIERSLHSDIVKYLIKMFHYKNINKNYAQLICASHDLQSLDDLKKSEVAIVEKINNETILKYITDFDIRNDLSFQKNYLSGRFGGLPNLAFDINMMDDEW